jgi:hypothetical protein
VILEKHVEFTSMILFSVVGVFYKNKNKNGILKLCCKFDKNLLNFLEIFTTKKGGGGEKTLYPLCKTCVPMLY